MSEKSTGKQCRKNLKTRLRFADKYKRHFLFFVVLQRISMKILPGHLSDDKGLSRLSSALIHDCQNQRQRKLTPNNQQTKNACFWGT